jgi:hypothetical protein
MSCRKLPRGPIGRVTVDGSGGLTGICIVIFACGVALAGSDPWVGWTLIACAGSTILVALALQSSICANGQYKFGIGPLAARRNLTNWDKVEEAPLMPYRAAPLRGIGRQSTSGHWELLPGSAVLGDERRSQWIETINSILAELATAPDGGPPG